MSSLNLLSFFFLHFRFLLYLLFLLHLFAYFPSLSFHVLPSFLPFPAPPSNLFHYLCFPFSLPYLSLPFILSLLYSLSIPFLSSFSSPLFPVLSFPSSRTLPVFTFLSFPPLFPVYSLSFPFNSLPLFPLLSFPSFLSLSNLFCLFFASLACATVHRACCQSSAHPPPERNQLIILFLKII